ncbi:nuclear transport factor 2 family protein [Hymenobacter busanensis]|uniref:Nuclear transport factor 2 family protein n=1 Tax=Hymenobacter busanensis TaxID=2607656 RepID=A0A7L4ZX67_9BACT|nr:nuclear transport factor 2 family protein [Hymenobacter busanensis]KAA9333467.1 nuclear transport factor 2 family protein [Hymenobacter busanensis]QHJ07851.1 DUF4440 domain-containing protein [Hymenobacter busanensis]
MKYLITFLKLLLATTLGFGQAHTADETALRAMLPNLATVIKKQDVKALDRYYTPDYLFVDQFGVRMNKAQRMAYIKSVKPFDMFVYEDVKVRFYGPATAIINSTVRNRVAGQAERKSSATLVMIKNAGVWQVASAQATPIVPAAPAVAAKR